MSTGSAFGSVIPSLAGIRGAVAARPRKLGYVIEELVNLVAPTTCPGCDAWDTTLCDSCIDLARQTPQLRVIDDKRKPLRLVTLGDYKGTLRKLVIAAKHDRKRDLTQWLELCGFTLGEAWLKHGFCTFQPTEENPVHVVPAPSQWTRAWQGMLVTPAICDGFGKALMQNDVPVLVAPVLHQRWGSTQAGLSGAERQRRRKRAITARVPLSGSNCVLVDDVVTTGSTMIAARDALEEVGAQCETSVSLTAVKNRTPLE